jgi:hypothetical protein
LKHFLLKVNQVYRFVDQNIRQKKLNEEEMVSAIIAVLLTRRLNLQPNGDTANSTRVYTEI